MWLRLAYRMLTLSLTTLIHSFSHFPIHPTFTEGLFVERYFIYAESKFLEKNLMEQHGILHSDEAQGKL